jgi:outer membrane protein TolC
MKIREGVLLTVFYLGVSVAVGIIPTHITAQAAVVGKKKPSTDDSSSPFSLREVIETALNNNASLREESLRKKVEEHSLNIQRAKFLPTVEATTAYRRGILKNIEDRVGAGSASGGIMMNSGDKEDYNLATAEIGLRYNLFNSGNDIISFNYRKHSLRAHEYSEEEKAQNIVYDAVVKYYNILFLETSRGVAQESENSYLELLESIKASHDVGLVSSIDRLQAENSYQSSRLDVMDADNKLKDGYADLNIFLGRDPDQIVNLEKPKMEVRRETVDVDEYIRTALLNRLDIKKMQELRKQAGEALKLTRISLLPGLSVDFNSGVRTGDVTDTRTSTSKFNRGKLVADTNIVATLKIPVFSGLSTLNAIRLKEKELEIVDTQLEELEREVSREVLVACRNFEHDQAAFFLSKDLLETKTSETRMILDMYATGARSLADVTKAQAELEKTKLSFIKFKHNWLTGRIYLLKLTGMISLESVINVSEF